MQQLIPDHAAPGATTIALIGDFDGAFPPHLATQAACAHGATALSTAVVAHWIPTTDATVDSICDCSGIWIAPGSPYKSLENTLALIRYARQQHLPCLGTCGGFQHIILEYARNALGYREAQHAEYDPYASDLFVSRLHCSLVGRRLRVEIAPGSRVAAIYGTTKVDETYYCDFGLNRQKVKLLSQGPLKMTGWDSEGEVRIVELPDHPFFIGTLFVPQLRSSHERPHPLVKSFLAAAILHRFAGGHAENPTIPAIAE